MGITFISNAINGTTVTAPKYVPHSKLERRIFFQDNAFLFHFSKVIGLWMAQWLSAKLSLELLGKEIL